MTSKAASSISSKYAVPAAIIATDLVVVLSVCSASTRAALFGLGMPVFLAVIASYGILRSWIPGSTSESEGKARGSLIAAATLPFSLALLLSSLYMEFVYDAVHSKRKIKGTDDKHIIEYSYGSAAVEALLECLVILLSIAITKAVHHKTCSRATIAFTDLMFIGALSGSALSLYFNTYLLVGHGGSDNKEYYPGGYMSSVLSWESMPSQLKDSDDDLKTKFTQITLFYVLQCVWSSVSHIVYGAFIGGAISSGILSKGNVGKAICLALIPFIVQFISNCIFVQRMEMEDGAYERVISDIWYSPLLSIIPSIILLLVMIIRKKSLCKLFGGENTNVRKLGQSKEKDDSAGLANSRISEEDLEAPTSNKQKDDTSTVHPMKTELTDSQTSDRL